MMDGRYLPLIALGGGIMGGRLGRGLQGFAQATMQGQQFDREARQDEQRAKMLEMQTLSMEGEAEARRQQAAYTQQALAGLPEDQRALVLAGGPPALAKLAEQRFAVRKPELVTAGNRQFMGVWNPETNNYDPVAGTEGPRWQQTQAAPVDQFQPLGAEELQALNLAPGTFAQRNTRTGKVEIGQQPQSGPAPIRDEIRNPDGSIQKVISYDNGRTWEPLGAVDPNLPKPIPTADGRAIMTLPDGTTKDVTPPVAGVDMMPQPAPTPVGPDMENAVGFGPVASEALSKTVGQFVGGANNPDVTEARTRLQLLTRQAQSAFALSGRPTNWEQQRISTMLPSDGVFESPDRARTALGVLKEDATRAYNEYGQLLQSPSLSDGSRSELMQKRLELKRLVESIDVGPQQSAAPTAPTMAGRPTGGAAKPRYRIEGGTLVPVP